jgi:hypothetical protein
MVHVVLSPGNLRDWGIHVVQHRMKTLAKIRVRERCLRKTQSGSGCVNEYQTGCTRSPDPVHFWLFARDRRWRTLGMANDNRGDGDGFRTKPMYCLPLWGIEPRFGKANPAGSEPSSIGSEHQVLPGEGAVLDSSGV